MRTIPSLRALIQDCDRAVLCFKLPPLFLDEDFDLDTFRKALIESPIGADDVDIFFPSWTKTVYIIHDEEVNHPKMSWEQIENAKMHIQSTEQLKALFEREEKMPGSISIIFQKCRSKRYSRKAVTTNPSAIGERNYDTGGQNHGRTRRHFHRPYRIPSHTEDPNAYSAPAYYSMSSAYEMNTFNQSCTGPPIPTYVGHHHPPAAPLITHHVYEHHGNQYYNGFNGQMVPYCSVPIRSTTPVIPQGYQIPWNVRHVEYGAPTWFLN